MRPSTWLWALSLTAFAARAAVGQALPCEFQREVAAKRASFTVAVPGGEACDRGTLAIVVVEKGGRTQKLGVARTGVPVQAWAADLSGEGWPELVVATQSVSSSAGSPERGWVTVVVRVGGRWRVRSVARPSPARLAGYRGGDSFDVRGGHLYRSFPLYRPGDPDATPSGGTARFKYVYRSNRWVKVP